MSTLAFVLKSIRRGSKNIKILVTSFMNDHVLGRNIFLDVVVEGDVVVVAEVDRDGRR